MHDILTHNGTLLISDYLVVFFAFMVTVLLQLNGAKNQHKEEFRILTFASDNWLRWILSINSALFLLYVLPDGYFWYMEEYIKSNPSGTTEWNNTLSAIIGLSPLYILKKLIKVSRTKLENEK